MHAPQLLASEYTPLALAHGPSAVWALLLLLELARCTEMCVELAGGSWIADLSVVTEHLVRNEVHPALARLGLPAKMLQNALKPAALRG